MLVVAVVLVTTVVGARAESTSVPIRLVLSSQSPASAATAVRSSSPSGADSPWRRFLAGERTCPGGQRTDLPAARQVATLVCLVNYARARRGLRRLPVARTLASASARKSRAILRCASFAHDPCGEGWKATLRLQGYQGSVGENLYLASGPYGAPLAAVVAWLDSPAHRMNLFRPEWREQGLAVAVLPKFEGSRDVALWVSVLGDGTAP